MLDQLTRAVSPRPATTDADAESIANILSVKRRCRIIDILSNRHAIETNELADKMAVLEFGPDYTSDERKCVYVGIYQNHIDILEEEDVVTKNDHRIEKGPAFAAYESALKALRARSAADVDRGNGVRADGGVTTDDIEGATKTRIKTAKPETEPEYVGSHSGRTSPQCQNMLGEFKEEIEQCDNFSTHTVVMKSASGLHEIAMCDGCGKPEDVIATDRNWSGEINYGSSESSERDNVHGFNNVPDDLVTEQVTVRCLISEQAPEFCDGWVTSVEIEPGDIRIDGYGRLHFPEHVPTECPECGDRVLAYNGVEVNFHV